MTALQPNTIYGWLGLALMGGSFLYHRSLSSMGMILGLGIGAYLYFIMDDAAVASSS